MEKRNLEKESQILDCAVLLKRSTSAPVTSVDRHTSTSRFNLRLERKDETWKQTKRTHECLKSFVQVSVP